MSEHTYSVVRSDLLVDAPIIALRRDEVTMPGGHTAGREIVEHFGSVVIAAVDKQQRIALVRQYRHSVGRRLWELPAGLLDFAGEEALEAAKRELAEEAGVKAETWNVLADVVTSPGFCDEASRIFLARDVTRVDKPVGEDEEADMVVEWVDLAEARRAVMAGHIVNSLAVSGILSCAHVILDGGTPRSVDSPWSDRPQALARRRQTQGVVPDMKKI
ncbi:ADP-ribose pyrophosphatase [Corynebacterium renale]|uniref:NUDIX domain-containing protein n=1 Tax=Corynebacterium renale TaxID=1724 RepID=UPI000DA29585|nr:NUDIX hydrolase [Corynebacterium renale]SQG64635.1 ADP-ribose pyrophosphatase [Corynebacterium renale]STC95787.1 ADP-ribose pyrophosphatase [Corynebacterium renale]